MRSSSAAYDDALAALSDYLARNGLKQTKQREAILEAFMTARGHMTSEQLYEAVRHQHPDIGSATVYRTLKLFCDAGIATSLHIRDGVTLYEREHSHHDHLICIGCGEIVEFESDTIEEQQEQIARKHGYQLVRHRHHLYGYCRRCQEKREKG